MTAFHSTVSHNLVFWFNRRQHWRCLPHPLSHSPTRRLGRFAHPSPTTSFTHPTVDNACVLSLPDSPTRRQGVSPHPSCSFRPLLHCQHCRRCLPILPLPSPCFTLAVSVFTLSTTTAFFRRNVDNLGWWWEYTTIVSISAKKPESLGTFPRQPFRLYRLISGCANNKDFQNRTPLFL